MERKSTDVIAIVSPDMMPRVEPPDDQEIITAAITDDTKLAFDDRQVDFGAEMDALNALLTYRAQPLRSEELRQNFGVESPPKTFRRQLGKVAAKLLDASGTELVQVDGATNTSMTYQLSPRFALTDQRDQPKSDVLTALRAQAEKEPLDDLRHNSLSTGLARQKLLVSILREYSTSFPMNSLFRQYASVLTHRNIAYDEWPTEEECKVHIQQMSDGVDAVLEGGNDTEKHIMKLVEAYHHLYYRHLHIIDGLARRHSSQWAKYEDLFQEGSLAFIEFGVNYAARTSPILDNPTGPENTFTAEAIVAITDRVRQADNFGPTSHLPKHVQTRQEAITVATELFIQKEGRHPTFSELSTMTELTKQQVIEAVADTRPYAFAEIFTKEAVDTAIEQAAIQEEIHLLLQEEALDEREKVVISLYYGIFTSHLSGAMFDSNIQDLRQFTYPYSKEEMPEDTLWAMSRISELLGVESARCYAILHRGLAKGRAVLVEKGITSLAEW